MPSALAALRANFGSALVALLVIVGLSTNEWAHGQSKERSRFPGGPALNPVPALSKWLVTYAYPQDRPSGTAGAPPQRPVNPELPRTILTTKTQKILHEETVSVSGKKLDRWQQGQTFYIKNEARKYWGGYDNAYQSHNPTNDPTLSPIPESGFRGLDWIKEETFAGAIRSGNGTLLVFVPTNAANLDVNDSKALEGQSVIAYVDSTTRLPVSVRENNVTRTYTFSPPPSALLTFPPDLAAAVKKGEETKARFNAAPLKEY